MRTGQCPKCGGTKIGYLENVLDVKSGNDLDFRIRVEEFRHLMATSVKKGWLRKEEHKAMVEAYVCTDCGFFEEYVKAPDKVPWDALPLFRWHSTDADSSDEPEGEK